MEPVGTIGAHDGHDGQDDLQGPQLGAGPAFGGNHAELPLVGNDGVLGLFCAHCLG